MRRHLLITGDPGVGKTTALLRAHALLDQSRVPPTDAQKKKAAHSSHAALTLRGFITREVRNDSGTSRVGFKIERLDALSIDRRDAVLESGLAPGHAHPPPSLVREGGVVSAPSVAMIARLTDGSCKGNGPTVGRYTVDVAAFEAVALPALRVPAAGEAPGSKLHHGLIKEEILTQALRHRESHPVTARSSDDATELQTETAGPCDESRPTAPKIPVLVAPAKKRKNRLQGGPAIPPCASSAHVQKPSSPASKDVGSETALPTAPEQRTSNCALVAVSSELASAPTRKAGRDVLSAPAGHCVHLVDEIGKMECFSKPFVEAMTGLLDGPAVTVVATVAQRGGGFIAAVKDRPDVDVLVITRSNRDDAPQRITDYVLSSATRLL